MDKKKAEEIIGKIESIGPSLKDLGVLKIGLFGSYLYGNEKTNSDIDLLVTLDDNGMKNYFDLWIYLDKLFGKKIDLVIEKNLLKRIEYVKKEARYARL